MKQALTLFTVGLACVVVAGCGAGDTGRTADAGSVPSSTAPPSTAPSSTAPSSTAPSSTAPPSPKPSNSAVRPDADDDFAALAKSVLTSKDVGQGWARQGGVTDTTLSHSKEVRKPVEYCPGHVSKSLNDRNALAGVSQYYTNKTSSLYLSSNTLATIDAGGLKANQLADVKACKEFKVDKNHYVVLTQEGPTTLSGADEVTISFAARHYGDKEHTALGYVGQYLTGRKGRVVTSVTYQFSPSKKDPQGKDFSRAQQLVERQLKNHAGQFDQ